MNSTTKVYTCVHYSPGFHGVVNELGRLNASRDQQDVGRDDEEGAHAGCDEGRLRRELLMTATGTLLPYVA